MADLKIKGLTMTIIFQAESANYGESVGNVASLKKYPETKESSTHTYRVKPSGIILPSS